MNYSLAHFKMVLRIEKEMLVMDKKNENYHRREIFDLEEYIKMRKEKPADKNQPVTTQG